jgi:hypothetical protein
MFSGKREAGPVDVSDCRSRAMTRETGTGLLWVSLLVASGILVSAWLQAGGPVPGLDDGS